MNTSQRDYETGRLTSRPSKETVEALKSVPTAFISDVLSSLGVKNYALRGATRIGSRQEVMGGPAVTLLLIPTNGTHPFSEAPYIHTEVIDRAEVGDVIVMAASGAPYAFFGEQMAKMAQAVGISGAVVDGCIRDSDAIRDSGLDIFCRGYGFESFIRHYETVAFNVPVPLMGAAVGPGDVVLGDSDGVLVVHAGLVDKVVTSLGKVKELEEWIAGARQRGISSSEIMIEVDRVTSRLSSDPI